MSETRLESSNSSGSPASNANATSPGLFFFSRYPHSDSRHQRLHILNGPPRTRLIASLDDASASYSSRNTLHTTAISSSVVAEDARSWFSDSHSAWLSLS